MFRYILDRIVAMFLTLFIIVSIAFMVVRLMPGSVYEMGGDLSQTVIDALNAKYHFDEPIIKQWIFSAEYFPSLGLGNISKDASKRTSI